MARAKTETILAFAFGASFLAALLVLAVLVSTPSPLAYTIFRVVLAVAAAGAAAVLPGALKVEASPLRSVKVRAAGALAVFAIVYLLNPGQLATNQETQVRAPTTAGESGHGR